MEIFSIDLSFWGGGVGSCALSRWWSRCSKTTVFVFIIVIFLPYVCSDDPHLLQASHDGLSERSYRFAEINITYTDPDTKKETFTKFRGKYGIDSVVASVSGVLMHAVSPSNGKGTNHYGCSQYTNKKFPSENWIALVQRGQCDFTSKIRMATKEHNASAVVIYNNSSGDEGAVMNHRVLSSISVFIQRTHGLKITELLDRKIPVHMHIWPGGQGTINGPLPNSISKTSVLFVSISFIVLMIISLAWLVFYYIQRFRYSHAKERLARRLACAAKKAIAKIPQKTVKVGDKELDSDFDQCAVCIEPYKAHDVIRILPCRHVFHKSCVDPWLLDQRSCPMCKLDILRAFGMQIGGSQESVHHDAESGPVTTVVQDEPEVSSSVEDTQTEDVKVLLVPHSCLHFHMDGDKFQVDDEDASTSLLGAVGGAPLPHASSSSSINSKGSLSSHSRAEKSDKVESGSSELKELIDKGKGGGKNKWKSKKEKGVEEDEDEIEDEEEFKYKDSDITDIIETVKPDQKKGKAGKPKKDSLPRRKASDSSSLSLSPTTSLPPSSSSSSVALKQNKKKASTDESKSDKEEIIHDDSDHDDDTAQGASMKTILHGEGEEAEMETKA